MKKQLGRTRNAVATRNARRTIGQASGRMDRRKPVKAAKTPKDYSKVLLIEHVRRKTLATGTRTECTAAQNRRIGVLVAGLRNSKVYVGACKCRSKDRFDPKFGVNMATKRMERAAKGHAHPVAWSLGEALEAFRGRCEKFFRMVPDAKDEQIILPPLMDKPVMKKVSFVGR